MNNLVSKTCEFRKWTSISFGAMLTHKGLMSHKICYHFGCHCTHTPTQIIMQRDDESRSRYAIAARIFRFDYLVSSLHQVKITNKQMLFIVMKESVHKMVCYFQALPFTIHIFTSNTHTHIHVMLCSPFSGSMRSNSFRVTCVLSIWNLLIWCLVYLFGFIIWSVCVCVYGSAHS